MKAGFVSLIGRPNAGKSTLLNTLTSSHVPTADRLFATLDTTSRHLRTPHEREILITDTVGFIRALPRDLLGAFRPTLDELRDADLLLHVVDASHPHVERHIESVGLIVNDLGLGTIPTVFVFNRSEERRVGKECRL